MREWARTIVLILVLIVAVLPSMHVSAANHGDGIFLYGEGTVTTPRYRTWTESTTTIGAEATGVAAAATIRHVIIKASPIRNEMLAGIQTTGGVLYIQRWNGTAWSNEWNVTVGDGNLPRFDISYEAFSGQALVVYTGNVATTNELRYRTWDGTAWVGPTNYNPARTTGIVDHVRLVNQSSTNNIGLVWGDRNFDLSGDFWNGASNVFTGEPAAALSTNLSKVGTSTTLTNVSFDIAFESVSGDMMVAWGNDAVLDLVYVVRTAGPSGAWGTVTTNTSFNEEPTDIELAPEPATDYIAYAAATDNGGDADAAIWTGSAWANINNFDTAIDTVAAGSRNITVNWLIKGTNSRAVVAYDDNNNAGIDWLFYNKNTAAWSAVQIDFAGAPAPVSGNDRLMQLRTNPYDPDNAMYIAVDNNSDLFAKRLSFDGTTLTWATEEPGGVALDIGVSSITGRSADYVYYRYSPGTLATDILDANDASVGSPSVAFPAATVGFTCQSSAASLGTSNEKVRVDNGTANSLWTLSIAATAGSTATWSSGLANYDFNDAGGSPAGCGDGLDADSVGGRLTIDPSVSSISSMLDCTTTGINKGSSSSYSQGVIDSITIASSDSSAQPSCFFDITGIGLSQQIPSDTPAGNYSLNLTLTVVAN